MFLPIIHNLKPSEQSYGDIRHYNRLISQKPKGADMSLDQKIEAQRLWKAQCQDALNTVNAIKMGE